MGAINNITLILVVKLGLGTQFTAKVLAWIGWWPGKGTCYFNHVDNDCFDAIAFALHFGEKLWHLIAIECIHYIAVYVVRHLGSCFFLFEESEMHLRILRL